jgi:hypothetical protein
MEGLGEYALLARKVLKDGILLQFVMLSLLYSTYIVMRLASRFVMLIPTDKWL